MTYLGMPFGMWTLFVPSFRNQLTAVFGYGTNTNCLFRIKKGRRISPTSSKLSGFIFSYLRYFLMCRFLLHLIHTSSLKCICIILILLRLSDHR